MRKRIRITLVAIAALVVVAVFATVIWYQTGGLDRYAESLVREQLAEMNIRLEVEHTSFGIRPGRFELLNVKLYPTGQEEPFLQAERLTVLFDVTSLWAQTAELKSAEIVRPIVTVRFDDQGRSNLDAIKLPEQKLAKPNEPDQIDLQAAAFSIVDGTINYGDARHKIDGTVNNLALGFFPKSGSGPDAIRRLNVEFKNSKLTYDERDVTGIAATLGADVTRAGATVDTANIESSLGTTTASGTVTDWKDPRYAFDVATTVNLERIGQIADPASGITGTGMLKGKLTGHGSEYAFDGDLSGNDVYVAGVRLASLSAKGQLQGDRLDYAWTGELIASRLTTHGYDVSTIRIAGPARIEGHGDMPTVRGQIAVGGFRGPGVTGTGLTFDGEIRAADQAASGDVSLSSLAVRTVRVGSIRAKVTAAPDKIEVPSFSASVYGGSIAGTATVRMAEGRSALKAQFRGVDLRQSLGAASPDAPEIDGKADGTIDLTWPGARIQGATGSVKANVRGTMPSKTGDQPVDGQIALTAVPGRLRIDKAEFTSGASRITATGDVGWDRRANINIVADAAQGSDLISLVSAANPEIAAALDQRKIAIEGPFHFDGDITGPLTNPSVDGKVSISRVVLNEEELGSFKANIRRDPAGLSLTNASINRSDGATIAFDLAAPSTGGNQRLNADITDYPLEALLNLSGLRASEDMKAFGGLVSGKAAVTIPTEGSIVDGLRGTLDLGFTGSKIKGEPLSDFHLGVTFADDRIDLGAFRLATARGALEGTASYEKSSKNYHAVFTATDLDLKLVEAMSASEGKPPAVTMSGLVSGKVDVTGTNGPDGNVLSNLTAAFEGKNVVVEHEPLEAMKLDVTTAPNTSGENVATVRLGADVRGARRELSGEIFVAREDLPFRTELALDGFDALTLSGAPPEGVTSRLTGSVRVEGFLGDVSAENGLRERLKLDGRFSEVSITADVDTSGRQYRFANRGDVVFGVAENALRFEKATFTGDQTEVTLSGDYALSSPAISNLTVSGDVNLALVRSLARDVFAEGTANIQATVAGPAGDPRFTGFADLKDLSLRIVDVPIAITSGNGRIVFTSNQALIESLTAQANGGRVDVDGGVLFSGLRPSRWRFGIDARQVHLTYPEDVRSILDGDLTLQGNRQLQVLSGTVNVRRAEFTRDIEINDLLSLDRRPPSSAIATGSPVGAPIRLDLNIEARDSIIIRNELADVAASASLVLTGAIDDPTIDGRATITRGTLEFRDNEYQINRGVVRFPGRLGGEITFDLQAESDIRGYRVTVGLAGTPDKTYPVLRSEPALTEPQIVSLILTGEIGSSDETSQNLGTQSVNLASALLTEAFSRSVEKRTGELFGINRFQIDPLVGGTNPSARLTIGRQVNKNLSILYSTNLSSGEDQVIQLEYKLSNKFSLVASRDENGAYGLDIRIRKRF